MLRDSKYRAYKGTKNKLFTFFLQTKMYFYEKLTKYFLHVKASLAKHNFHSPMIHRQIDMYFGDFLHTKHKQASVDHHPDKHVLDSDML